MNDDDLRVGYDGNWTRNNNNEVPAVSEPLTVAVTDSGTPAPPVPSNGGTRTVELNNDNARHRLHGFVESQYRPWAG